MKNQLCAIVIPVLLTACASIKPIDKHTHPQVYKLQKAAQLYNQLDAQHWESIEAKTPMKLGEQNQSIPIITKRLTALGDWPNSCSRVNPYQFDTCFHIALMNFQNRHGLKADGVLGSNTLNELNISPKERMRAIQNSIHTWSKMPGIDASPYIYINIPAYELKAINKGNTELNMRVIVGQPSWPTPEITSELKTVVLNPHWNVPVNITEKEIIHKIIKNPNYLEEHNLRVIENWSNDAKEINPLNIDWKKYAGEKDLPYRLTQAPGNENALGRIKFFFPNKEHIYLHDTPAKSLFDLPKRDLSHGCIRLQQPMALLRYLSKTNPNLAYEKIAVYLNSDKTKYLALKKHDLPLRIIYATSWVDEQGNIQFRPDIYAHLK